MKYRNNQLQHKIGQLASRLRKPFWTQDMAYNAVVEALSGGQNEKKLWTWRYPYSVERGYLKPSKRFIAAVNLAYQELFEEKKPKDPRHGAIRFAVPPGVDGHAERKLILEELTPLERYYALRHARDMKGYDTRG